MRPRLIIASLSVRLACLLLCYLMVIGPALFTVQGSANASRDKSLQRKSTSVNKSREALNSAFTPMMQGGSGVSDLGYNLPNLDTVRQAQPADPVAPPPIASNQPCASCTSCTTCNAGTANHPPVANAGGPYSGRVNQNINFSGMASFDADPNDRISSYQWNFGDNTSGTGPAPAHTYAAAGNYTVTLTVRDTLSVSAIASQSVSVNPPSAPPSTTQSGQGNAAVFVKQTVPLSMESGQRYPVSVTMKNTGATTWTSARLYRLGSENPGDNTNWGLNRIAVPASIPPGDEATFNFTVTAPPADYEEGAPAHFQWRMVQDGVEWFGGDSNDVAVAVEGSMVILPTPQPPQNLSSARLEPTNRTGEPDVDLLSGNFNWSLPLMGLAGRAGLDLGLALTYNSLVWTEIKAQGASDCNLNPDGCPASAITFDADQGFPGPGFRLGFPSIQGPFTNDQADYSSSYLMITPSGSHVELRQINSYNIYESVDSSHLQLIDGGDAGELLVRTMNGTLMTYLAINGEYRCTGIKDRNGNYLTVKYDSINGGVNFGHMTSVIDTVGRVVNFNYDANYRLQSITQTWDGPTHVWASFGYTDLNVQTNFRDFSGKALNVYGLPANNTISVLTRIGLDDGSHYDFSYTSWGQVWTIYRFARDGNQLGYTRYNLPVNNSTPQADCPRFTQRLTQANDWNASSPVMSTYQFALEGESGKATMPDGTVYEETYANGGWQKGLRMRTDTYSSDNLSTPKKTATTAWTQDNTSLLYKLNPLPAEIIVRDANKRRKTTLEYTSYGLLFDAFEWEPNELDPDGNEKWLIIRRTHTDYNLSDVYLNRHIIGLPAAEYVFARNVSPDYQSQVLMSKTTYEYDEGGDYLQDQGNPVQHDAAFAAGFTARGNRASARRWNVNDENSMSASIVSRIGYNTAGAVIFARDPMWQAGQAGHQINISYTDSGTGAGNTLAYPTTVTDGDGFSSTSQYRYDIGALTRKQNPRPQGTDQDPVQTYDYDGAGRLKQLRTLFNQANTQWVYPTSQTVIVSKTTINDLNNPAYSFDVLDGAGRVRATASDNPDGSVGHYIGQYTTYDNMGRAIRQYNPVEMDSAWTAKGDDDHLTGSGGWRFSSQSYDWKGRPTLTINTNSTSRSISYDSCGCAGSDTETMTDEVGRQQKVSKDSLGRVVVKQILNSNLSIYTATRNTYNVLDQVTSVKQYQGPETSSVYQETTMHYDGHGRLDQRHSPEQINGTGQPVFTTYEYNLDDTLKKVTDGRGATANYSYNNSRHLVNSISYTSPDTTTIPVPAMVNVSYDPAGNRTQMLDGSGSVSYQYDALSHMTSETRSFNGLNGSYTLGYTYNLAGQLASLTDSTQAQINYSYNARGQLTGVSGTAYASISQYASDFKYRAWGAMKHMVYGNGLSLDRDYDTRLQAKSFNVHSLSANLLKAVYEYNPDGRVHTVDDQTDDLWDRSYTYDDKGRLSIAAAGAAAGLSNSVADTPYYETFGYDEWGNLKSRNNQMWSGSESFTATYANNRRQSDAIATWQYDAVGNATSITHTGSPNYQQYTIDAAGRTVQNKEHSHRSMGPHATQLTTDLIIDQNYDADGQRTKRLQTSSTATNSHPPTTSQKTLYYLRSSLLGGRLISELNETGQKQKTYVYAGSDLLAIQQLDFQGQPEIVFSHIDPISQSNLQSNASGQAMLTIEGLRRELDPLGAEMPQSDPYTAETDPQIGGLSNGGGYAKSGDPFNPESGCAWNGNSVPCSMLSSILMYSDLNEKADSRQESYIEYRYQGGEGGGFGFGFSAYTIHELVKSRIVDPNTGEVYSDWSAGTVKEVKVFGMELDHAAQTPQNTKQQPDQLNKEGQTACLVQADVAQNEADDAFRWADSPANALRRFDNEFSRLFHGGPITSIREAQRWSNGTGREINPFYASNGSGFQDKFRDTGTEGFPIGGYYAEQTHHFSAYLSMGINRLPHIYYYGMWGDNDGDKRLSEAAFNYGLRLRNHPEELRTVGQWMRQNICNGKGHGLYY